MVRRFVYFGLTVSLALASTAMAQSTGPIPGSPTGSNEESGVVVGGPSPSPTVTSGGLVSAAGGTGQPTAISGNGGLIYPGVTTPAPKGQDSGLDVSGLRTGDTISSRWSPTSVYSGKPPGNTPIVGGVSGGSPPPLSGGAGINPPPELSVACFLRSRGAVDLSVGLAECEQSAEGSALLLSICVMLLLLSLQLHKMAKVYPIGPKDVDREAVMQATGKITLVPFWLAIAFYLLLSSRIAWDRLTDAPIPGFAFALATNSFGILMMLASIGMSGIALYKIATIQAHLGAQASGSTKFLAVVAPILSCFASAFTIYKLSMAVS